MIVAYMGEGGPLCIACALKRHPEIADDPFGEPDSSWFPISNAQTAELLKITDERCYGEGGAHAVLSAIAIVSRVGRTKEAG